MHSSLIITLGLHFLLYQRVTSSRDSFFKDQTLSFDKVDNFLGKFLAEFKEVYLQKNEPWLVAIIGGSTDELRRAQSLFESYPYVICADPETCDYPDVFNSMSFLVVFLDDLGEKTLEKNLKILSDCEARCEFLFVFEGTINRSNEISSFLSRVMKQGVVYSALAHLDKDAITFYRLSPAENCSTRAESMFVWKPGTDLYKIDFSNPKTPDLKGCTIPVGSFQYKPRMVIEEKKNGSLTIASGFDGLLVLLIAEKLNVAVDLRYPSSLDPDTHSLRAAVVNDVNLGIIAFGVGRFRPKNISRFSVPYDQECIVWAVPRRISSNLVWKEFRWKVWALIGLVFVVICAIEYARYIIDLSRNANRQDADFVTIILDTVSINLGNPAIRVPVSVGSKLFFITYLYYAMVITTAYKTSLASALATVESSSAVTDTRELVEANLKIGGSLYSYDIIKEQMSVGELFSELVKRYIVYYNASEGLARVQSNQDFAYLAQRSVLNYEKQLTVKAKQLIRFNILNDCILTYPTVMAFPKGSLLLAPVNKLIRRLSESGLLQYWSRFDYANDQILEKNNADRFSGIYRRQKFEDIFMFYIGCIVLCLLVFFIEILTARFKPKKKQRYAPRRN